jgi:hypothetical protein
VSGAVAKLQSDAPVLQPYEHFEPLQVAEDAFVRLHTSPQALQSVGVFSSVQVLPHVVSVQVHDPLTQLGVGCAQVVRFCHVPVVLQFWVVFPLQSVWPGAHTPVHTPFTQVWPLHATSLPYVPLAVQVSTLLPEHVTWVGAHVPVQTPLMHVWLVHAAAVPQLPPELHVCTPLPEHCRAPGEHDPAHAPLTHAEPVQATAPPQVPLVVHV